MNHAAQSKQFAQSAKPKPAEPEQESEERFRTTFEQAAVGIAHVGLEGRWLRANPKLCEILGYAHDELLQLTFQDITYAEDLQVVVDGPGIASEHHNKIFGIFQTLTARDLKESTGIGLSIVKKIVEAEGGKVGLDSALGKGAKFYFLWPKQPITGDR